MPYYVQEFQNNRTNAQITAIAEYSKHDHDRSNQFSKDVKDWLSQKGRRGRWERGDIRDGKFRSGQENVSGKAFHWDKPSRKWVRG